MGRAAPVRQPGRAPLTTTLPQPKSRIRHDKSVIVFLSLAMVSAPKAWADGSVPEARCRAVGTLTLVAKCTLDRSRVRISDRSRARNCSWRGGSASSWATRGGSA